jgi:hypothetical protein
MSLSSPPPSLHVGDRPQGFIVLCGSLEIMSRNIVSGSVRMCYAVVYSLFLGLGLAMGAEAYQKITTHAIIGSTDYTCSISHDADGAWYQRTPSSYWGTCARSSPGNC